MNAWQVAVAGVAGVVIGLALGALNLLLERIEHLREEEEQERVEYERDISQERLKAAQAGAAAPEAPAWQGERYGWTWLELVLSPLLCALGFTAFTAHGPLDHGLFIHLLWVAVFVQIVCFDLKHRLILDKVTYPSIALALALSPVSPGLDIVRAVIGAAGVASFFLLLNLISRGGIGMGDAKLGALVGAVMGAGADPAHIGAVYGVIYAIFLGGGTALLLWITRIRHLRDSIPYGPFLCAGAAIILYQGP